MGTPAVPKTYRDWSAGRVLRAQSTEWKENLTVVHEPYKPDSGRRWMLDVLSAVTGHTVVKECATLAREGYRVDPDWVPCELCSRPTFKRSANYQDGKLVCSHHLVGRFSGTSG